MRMKGYFLTIVIQLGIGVGIMGQVSGQSDFANENIFEHLQKVEPDKGIITIEQSEGMKDLVLTRIDMNKRSGGVEGFRVQLFSGVGSKARQEAMDVKAKVLKEFPDENIFIEYSAPFWRVRVGSFRHKYEALPLMKKLRKMFPACYIVRTDDIALKELKIESPL
jgi:hypothetical protein